MMLRLTILAFSIFGTTVMADEQCTADLDCGTNSEAVSYLQTKSKIVAVESSEQPKGAAPQEKAALTAKVVMNSKSTTGEEQTEDKQCLDWCHDFIGNPAFNWRGSTCKSTSCSGCPGCGECLDWCHEFIGNPAFNWQGSTCKSTSCSGCPGCTAEPAEPEPEPTADQGCPEPADQWCPRCYRSVPQNLDGSGKLWAQPNPGKSATAAEVAAAASRTIQQCADICNARSGCTAFEFASGPNRHGQCGTYTGGNDNIKDDENRLAPGSNYRSCMKV